jgi:Retrotransposon gag protein/Zinc knuckle
MQAQQQQQPAAVPAAAAPRQPRVKLELKPFSGSSAGGMGLEGRIFLRKVTQYAAVSRLNDEQTAQAVGFALTDTAQRWYGTLAERNPPGNEVVNTWADLRPLFVARFCRQLTAAELAKLSRELIQVEKETVDDFLDRCEELQHLEEERIPNAQKAQVTHDNGVLMKFLSGLKTVIREKVSATATAETLADYVTAAQKAEASLRDEKKTSASVVLALEGQEPHKEGTGEGAAAGAAVDAVGGSRRGNQRGGGGRGGRGGRGGGRDLSAMKCYYCGIKGHLIADCRKRQREQGGANRGGFQGYARGGGGNNHQGGGQGGQGNFVHAIAQALHNALGNQGQQGGNQGGAGGGPSVNALTGGGFQPQGGGGGYHGFQGF